MEMLVAGENIIVLHRFFYFERHQHWRRVNEDAAEVSCHLMSALLLLRVENF